jgi:hypothetical protein
MVFLIGVEIFAATAESGCGGLPVFTLSLCLPLKVALFFRSFYTLFIYKNTFSP